MLSVRTWPVTRKSEMHLANIRLDFSFKTRKRKMVRNFDLQFRGQKGFQGTKREPIARFHIFGVCVLQYLSRVPLSARL